GENTSSVDGAQPGEGPSRTGAGSLLYGPVTDIGWRTGLVVDLEKVVLVCRSGVAAAAVYLADFDGGRRGRRLHGKSDRQGTRARLSIRDRKRQRFRPRGGYARHGCLEGEDIIAGGDVAVGSVIEKLLGSGASDRRKVGSNSNSRAGRIGPTGDGSGQESRVSGLKTIR